MDGSVAIVRKTLPTITTVTFRPEAINRSTIADPVRFSIDVASIGGLNGKSSRRQVLFC